MGFLKKLFCFSLIAFFSASFVFAEGTYTYRTIEAHSSQSDPNVLDVTSTYEHKDENGEVTKDSKTEQVNVQDGFGYRIKAGDDGAGVTVEAVSGEEIDKEVRARFDAWNESMREWKRHFDDIRVDSFFDDRFFEEDPFFRRPIRRRFFDADREVPPKPKAEIEEPEKPKKNDKPGKPKKAKAPKVVRPARKKGYFENLADWMRYLRAV